MLIRVLATLYITVYSVEWAVDCWYATWRKAGKKDDASVGRYLAAEAEEVNWLIYRGGRVVMLMLCKPA